MARIAESAVPRRRARGEKDIYRVAVLDWASRSAPYGARSGRVSIELASASFTNRSAFASQVSGRFSFIAIQLTMHALLLACATGAGASGCFRDWTHSSQFL